MKLMARAQFSGLRLDGLKKEKSLQNIFLTLRREGKEKKRRDQANSKAL